MIEGMRNTSKSLRVALPLVLTAGLLVSLLVPLAPARAQDRPVPVVAAPQADRYALDQTIPVDPRITVGRLSERPPLLDPREPGAEEPGRAAPRRQRRARSSRTTTSAGWPTSSSTWPSTARRTSRSRSSSSSWNRSACASAPTSTPSPASTRRSTCSRIPTDSAEILKTAFLILEDWAHGLTFDPKAIDKERGIIIEEWRLGQGADARMRDKQFPILLSGSRYAERLPDREEGDHRELRV